MEMPFQIEIKISAPLLNRDRSRRKIEMPFPIEMKELHDLYSPVNLENRSITEPIKKLSLAALWLFMEPHVALPLRNSSVVMADRGKSIHHISPFPGRAAPSDRLPCTWKHLQVATGRIANGSPVRAARRRVLLSPFLLASFLNC